MSNKLRKPNVSVSAKKENPYQHFNFTRNPFPKNAGVNIGSDDPRENGSIYCPELFKEEEKQFEKLFIPKPSNPDTNRIAFLTDYTTRRGRGLGKTAFLNYQKKRIMKDFSDELSEGEQVIFSIYVLPTPGGNYNHFWKISQLIITKLIEQNILAEAICRLKAFSGLIPQDVLAEVGDNLVDTLGRDSWLQEKNVSVFNLKYKINTLLERLNIDVELANMLAFGGLGISDYSNVFHQFTDSYWRKNGNRLLFSDLVRLFQEAGFTKGIILFDELEKVFPPLNRQDRRLFVEALRYYFIDGDSENARDFFYSVLFTIHPYLQELMAPHWQAAGLERFASIGGDLANHYHIYFSSSMGIHFAVPLAKSYIIASRVPGYDNDPLLPFEEAALLEAFNHTNYVPGLYLKILHFAVEKAIEEKAATITVDIIKRTASTVIPVESENEDNVEPLPNPLINLKDE